MPWWICNWPTLQIAYSTIEKGNIHFDLSTNLPGLSNISGKLQPLADQKCHGGFPIGRPSRLHIPQYKIPKFPFTMNGLSLDAVSVICEFLYVHEHVAWMQCGRRWWVEGRRLCMWRTVYHHPSTTGRDIQYVHPAWRTMVRRFGDLLYHGSPEIGHCPRLHTLFLPCGIPSNLYDMTSLQRLTLYDAHETHDWSRLSHLTQLTRLTLQHAQIGELTPLQKLSQLTHLSLYHVQHARVDLTPLSTLTQLQHLCLDRMLDVTAVTPLKPLVNLRRLFLSYTDVQSLEALSQMKKLEILHLYHTSIRDLNPLSTLTSLTELNLSYCTKLYDLSPLSTLCQLQYLRADHTRACLVPGLSTLTRLRCLNACYDLPVPREIFREMHQLVYVCLSAHRETMNQPAQLAEEIRIYSPQLTSIFVDLNMV
jgi:Leucine Rich repeats (2 copies)